jgi:FkbM family methyltransferase
MRSFWKAAVRLYPFSRGRARLIKLARRRISGIVVCNDRLGNRLLLDLDNLIDTTIFLEGSYESQALHTLAEHANQRGCTHFIDVGANLGVYSLFFARIPAFKELWAFEPDPHNHAQFVANLWLNQLSDRVHVSDVALSAQDGTTTFYTFNRRRLEGGWNFNTGTSSLLKAGSKNHTPITVQTRRLDNLLLLSGQNILMKIDVEGAEQMVLDGAHQLLKNNRCLVMLEVWSTPADGLEKMAQYMSNLGYTRVPADLGPENYLFAN